MKEESKIRLIKYLFIAILAIVFMYLYFNPEDESFHSIYEPGSDSYMEDSLTFAHPEWSYERIQEELYGKPVE